MKILFLLFSILIPSSSLNFDKSFSSNYFRFIWFIFNSFVDC